MGFLGRPELSGYWTYRSFNPAYVMGIQTPQEERKLILADGFVFNLQTPTSTTPTLVGTFESRDGGFPLFDLRGTVRPGAGGEPVSFYIVGTGRTDAGTEGWEYRYHGHLTHNWPKPPDANAVDQRPALVGSVIRVKPHDAPAGYVLPLTMVKAPAGYVAPFMAVKPLNQ